LPLLRHRDRSSDFEKLWISVWQSHIDPCPKTVNLLCDFLRPTVMRDEALLKLPRFQTLFFRQTAQFRINVLFRIVSRRQDLVSPRLRQSRCVAPESPTHTRSHLIYVFRLRRSAASSRQIAKKATHRSLAPRCADRVILTTQDFTKNTVQQDCTTTRPTKESSQLREVREHYSPGDAEQSF
jgi:hypothetical protein